MIQLSLSFYKGRLNKLKDEEKIVDIVKDELTARLERIAEAENSAKARDSMRRFMDRHGPIVREALRTYTYDLNESKRQVALTLGIDLNMDNVQRTLALIEQIMERYPDPTAPSSDKAMS